MALRMRDSEVQDEQQRNCLAEHIAPLNLLADELRQDGWAPYIAPIYGGTRAKLLYVLRDPGPKTQDEGESGFLCWENDDPTAETLCTLFSAVGIEASDVVPWNAYPWYINRNPKAAVLEFRKTKKPNSIGILLAIVSSINEETLHDASQEAYRQVDDRFGISEEIVRIVFASRDEIVNNPASVFRGIFLKRARTTLMYDRL